MNKPENGFDLSQTSGEVGVALRSLRVGSYRRKIYMRSSIMPDGVGDGDDKVATLSDNFFTT